MVSIRERPAEVEDRAVRGRCGQRPTPRSEVDVSLMVIGEVVAREGAVLAG